MANSCVLKVSKQTMSDMDNYYQPFKKNKVPPYAIFSAKKGTTTITAYTSGKVMFQGASAEEEASLWNGETNVSTTKQKKETSSLLPQDFENWSVLGSDEVGNGSYFGPVVVCASYVASEKIPLLKELGVRDSKELTDTRIREIAKDIKQCIPYKQLVVSPKKYNQIQPSYNVNHMKVVLHNQAIYLLLQDIAPIEPDGILIDQFTPEKNYRKYLNDETHQVTENLYFTTKGEHYHLSVAAASIICRASFLEELDKSSKELGFSVPSGAGPKSDKIAAQILKKGGMPLLENYAKLHFANTKKAQLLL